MNLRFALAACAVAWAAFVSPATAPGELARRSPIAYVVSMPSAAADRIHVDALVPAGHTDLYMWSGARPDERSRHIVGLRAETFAGAGLPVSYEASTAHWQVGSAGGSAMRIAYGVDLAYLRRLPQWARLQNGFFEGAISTW